MAVYVLDTHALIWAAISPNRLSSKARRLISDPSNAVAVSAISFWEISLKHALGKLALTGCTPEDLPPAAQQMGFDLLPLDAETSASFHRLPRLGHKDPFDRMLIWQCIRQDAVLVSKDSALKEYASLGLKSVW